MPEVELGQTPRELASGPVESEEKGNRGRGIKDDCEDNGVVLSDALGVGK